MTSETKYHIRSILYCRCGYLVLPVYFPTSLLRNGVLQWVIEFTYNNNNCRCNTPIRSPSRSRARRSIGSRSSVISMGNLNQNSRDINRTPKWFSRNCRRNRQHHRHRLVHKLWRYMKRHRPQPDPHKSWLCPAPSRTLTATWSCRRTHGPNAVHFCSWEEINTVVARTWLWFNWHTFRQRHGNRLSAVERPNCDLQTEWPCSQQTGQDPATCQWPLESSPVCNWREVNGQQSWECPLALSPWSWRNKNRGTECQWRDSVCTWQDSSSDWRCFEIGRNNTPWQWQNNPGEEDSQTWQWQHNNGDCLWDCETSSTGQFGCMWPLGETPSAVIKWSTPNQLTGRWQWPTSHIGQRSWQWQRDSTGRFDGWSWPGMNWQWQQSSDGDLTWQCQTTQGVTNVWSWQESTRQDIGLWNCQSISNDWQWQTQNKAGIVWQETEGRTWPWHPMWQWQTPDWRCLPGGTDRTTWLWQQTAQAWQWHQ